MLSPEKKQMLKEMFENFGRLPEEDLNTTFLNVAIEMISSFLKLEITDTLIDKPIVSYGVMHLALYLYNERDFQNKMNQEALGNFIMGLLAPIYNQSKFIENMQANENDGDLH